MKCPRWAGVVGVLAGGAALGFLTAYGMSKTDNYYKSNYYVTRQRRSRHHHHH